MAHELLFVCINPRKISQFQCTEFLKCRLPRPNLRCGGDTLAPRRYGVLSLARLALDHWPLHSKIVYSPVHWQPTHWHDNLIGLHCQCQSTFLTAANVGLCCRTRRHSLSSMLAVKMTAGMVRWTDVSISLSVYVSRASYYCATACE